MAGGTRSEIKDEPLTRPALCVDSARISRTGQLVKGEDKMETLVTTKGGVLAIRALEVKDDVVVSYISHLEPEMQAAGVVNCLQLGARALTFASNKAGAELLADTFKSETESTRLLLNQVSKTAEQAVAKSAEALEKAIAHQLTSLEKDLDNKLDPANTTSIVGRLRSALLDDYGRVTAKVREDLDLANPHSPLSALRAELYKEEERRYEALAKRLGNLLETLATKAGATAGRSKSTLKGNDFEAATEEFLTIESRPRKDLVRRTGREFGLDQNQVGDFVIEINPGEAPGARIAIETKNGHKSMAELVRQLDKAIKNRGAAFGVAVVGDSAIATQAITPFGDDKLIVRVPAFSADEWDFTALGIALEGARWKTIMGRTTVGSLDANRVRADIDAAFHITNRFVEVKRKITSSKSQLDDVYEYVEDIKRDLLTVLQRISNAVSEAQARPEAA